eukprot:908904-Prymnesium_polylepis.1
MTQLRPTTPARTLNSHPGASEWHPGPWAVPTYTLPIMYPHPARVRCPRMRFGKLCALRLTRTTEPISFCPSRVCRSRSEPISSTRTFTAMSEVLEGDRTSLLSHETVGWCTLFFRVVVGATASGSRLQ